MKIFINTISLRLDSQDPEENTCFLEEANIVGLNVKTDKLNRLEAFGDEFKLYLLLCSLACEWNLEIH